MSQILSTLRPALTMLALLTALFGFIYPGVSTVLVQLLFPHQAQGSLILGKDGTVLGSKLIGQPFSQPQYFWGRLSATTPFAYNAASSGGSNLGPANPALFDAVKARVDALLAADPDNKQRIPVDLVTASASGLDPDISPDAADYQIARVAKARGKSIAEIRALVERYTQPRQFGFLGEARVNVLQLNLALDGKIE